MLIGGVLFVGVARYLGLAEMLKRTAWYLSPSSQNQAGLLVAASAAGGDFPVVSGFNLLGDQFFLPSDLTTPYSVVILVYDQPQQSDVYTWVPLLEAIETDFADVRYYELPTLPEFNAAFRAQVDRWMIDGIPDEAARDRTITLYLDVEAFNQRLGIDNPDEIQLLLITSEGDLLWRESGAFSAAKGQALQNRIRSLVD
ncbi:MAG: hypothetical protein AAF283_10305 [Cyanobacteria bacterium P01_A01_bin.70]